MATTLDGRQWSGYITSRHSGFVGKRFIKSCKGSHRCGNELCGYFRQVKKVNWIQFEKNGSIVKCSTCGATAQFVPFPCKKILVYCDGDAKVTVYYYGTHTWVPIKRAPSTTDEVTVAFQLSRTLKPERLVNDKLIEAIEKEESLQDIEDLADGLVDRNTLCRMKYTAKEKLELVGHSYDAVMQYYEKCKKCCKIHFLSTELTAKGELFSRHVRSSYNLQYRWIARVRATWRSSLVMSIENTMARQVISQFPSLSMTQISERWPKLPQWSACQKARRTLDFSEASSTQR